VVTGQQGQPRPGFSCCLMTAMSSVYVNSSLHVNRRALCPAGFGPPGRCGKIYSKRPPRRRQPSGGVADCVGVDELPPVGLTVRVHALAPAQPTAVPVVHHD